MGRKLRSLLCFAAPLLSVLCVLQTGAYAEPLQMTLLGTPTGWNMGGVYTSPYSVRVGDATQAALLLACDDFTTSVDFHDTWFATEYTLADAANGLAKFTGNAEVFAPGGGPSGMEPVSLGIYSAGDRYLAAAYLTQDLLFNPAVNGSQTATGQYSYAIWQTFYKYAYRGLSGTHELSAANRVVIANLMGTAFTKVTQHIPLDYALNVYTPCGLTAASCATPNLGASQEFLGMTPLPESSSLVTLMFDLFGVLVGIAFAGKALQKARAS